MFGIRDLIPKSREREVVGGRRSFEHPLMTVQREIDRAFDEMWRLFDVGGHVTETKGWMVSPRIDVADTEKEVVITAELPGLEEKDIVVDLSDGLLIIKGEKKAEQEKRETGYVYSERSFGSFERRIPIDADILDDKTTAVFKNGVLTVTLPKDPAIHREGRRITISAEPTVAEPEKTLS